MVTRRRGVAACFAALPLLLHAACSTGNGDPIPDSVYDAAGIDAGGNPGDPEGGNVPSDDSSTPVDAGVDAPADAAKDVMPAPSAVQIGEIYVDRILDGDGAEFVELRAAPGTRADDLKIRIIGPTGAVKYEVSCGNAGDVFNATGLWTVGGSSTFRLNVMEHVDHVVGLSTWGLDYPGAVQVVRGTTLLDVVGFTDVPDGGAVPNVPQPPTATAEKQPVLLPDNSGATSTTKRISFGRKTGAADTNDNTADFCAMEASPGYAQKPCK